ncbi:MAG TPA: lipid II flippase MurJ [Lacisediminihabitans sp.]|uniref:murein biosynthesis integral membrane protein MurJ n=1 Tax=Lacisediminihabitans sp. TaxID=2787631 RepID=UPI002ED9D548
MSDPAGSPAAQDEPATEAVSAAGMGRASAILAAGTVVSRVLGFVRTIVLAATIGTAAAGDAFAVGNQLPNNIYALIAGGVLSAVLVPQIVRATANRDGGQQFVNRIVTLGMVLFGVVTLAATLAAPALVNLYASSAAQGRGFTPDALALSTAFAYWCLPQVFFYGLYSLLSEVLNARRIFGPFTWAPILNNLVSLAGLVAFMLLFGARDGNQLVSDWDTGRIVLLGATTTAAVAAQALVLFLFWRRAGLRYRPDFHWRGVGLGATGRAAGWLFGMVLVTQVAGIFQSRVASQASGHDASVVVLQNSWLIFMLPFSIIAVSIVTAYFTRMSGHGGSGDLAGVQADASEALRSIGLLIVFAAVALSVVAYPFARFFTPAFVDVSAMGNVILSFMPGLILYTVLFVLQRVFYSLSDTRTPFLVQCIQSALFIVGALACSALPKEWIAVGLAGVTTVTFGIQAVITVFLTRRRIGGLGGIVVLVRYLQYLGMSLVAGAVGLVVLILLGGASADGFGQSGRAAAIVTVVVTGLVMSGVYLGLLGLFRNPELAAVTSVIGARFRRGRRPR